MHIQMINKNHTKYVNSRNRKIIKNWKKIPIIFFRQVWYFFNKIRLDLIKYSGKEKKLQNLCIVVYKLETEDNF